MCQHSGRQPIRHILDPISTSYSCLRLDLSLCVDLQPRSRWLSARPRSRRRDEAGPPGARGVTLTVWPTHLLCLAGAPLFTSPTLPAPSQQGGQESPQSVPKETSSEGLDGIPKALNVPGTL